MLRAGAQAGAAMLALEQFVRSKGQMNTFFKNVRESADGIALPSRPFLRSRKGFVFELLFGCFRSRSDATRKPFIALAAQNHKGIVIAVHRPRTWRHFAEFYELPIACILVTKAQIIANSWGDIQTCTLVQIGPRALVSENILPMIRAERAAIFPLRITNSISVSNSDPPTLENSLAVASESLLEPGNHLIGFRFGVTAFDIVVRQSGVKWILARHKIQRDKISAIGRFGVVITSIAEIPIPVPGTPVIRNRVIAARALANPEDRSYDAEFPRITAGTATQSRSPAHQ